MSTFWRVAILVNLTTNPTHKTTTMNTVPLDSPKMQSLLTHKTKNSPKVDPVQCLKMPTPSMKHKSKAFCLK